MKKLILHAGMPKTGTTAFQFLLGKYADKLSNFSIHIANSPNREPYVRQYTEISEYLLRINLDTHLRQWFPHVLLPSVREEFLLDIKSNLESPCENVIMSSEDLFFIRSEEELEKLVNLTERTIHVVIALRSPKSFLKSYRNQIYKNNMLPSLHKDSVNYVESDSWIVNYEEVKSLYEKFTGKIICKFIDYEKVTMENGSVLKDLWDSCLLPPEIPNENDFLSFNNTANDNDRFHLDLIKINLNGFNICHSVDHSYYAIHGSAGAVTDNKSLENGIASGLIIKKSSYRELISTIEDNKTVDLSRADVSNIKEHKIYTLLKKIRSKVKTIFFIN